ncbi:hypothetical protein CgunFtcFv8_011150 [Champsocephalus gunnari]|uniref:Uncharacterized protein n=1 Tax=Champsocephalus gunnari TaxID=52237 RepID=A0AAN8HW37_CHAGU|nr:hypothetical protein CgunFtcFv8_011150 [Champsocephalus gunnari]
MIKSLSVSSESSLPSLPSLDDDSDSVYSDELLGSQSRRWLADLLTGDLHVDNEDVKLGRDGLFVDYQFPLGELELQAGVKWKRPVELCASPQFIVNGATRLDLRQGTLSDCWLLSAIASLSVHRSLLKKVMPLEQSFQEGYSGCFTFKFWQYGQWEEVQVDDRLPTRDNSLIYLSSPERHEFWSSLLEKAYAKVKGGYRALNMGFPHEAMVDMTGGVTETLAASHLTRDPLAFLSQLLAKGALINCANCQGPLEQRNELGIMFRHAYSLTAVERVQTAHGTVDLVRLLNPWGNSEWEGPWSDMQGPEWKSVSVGEQSRLQRVRREDGEFWMLVSDFQQNFETLEVCHLTEPIDEGGSSVPWCSILHHGNWVPYISAGGSALEGSFWQNPQFYFTLSEVDSSTASTQKTCSFVLALMQKHQRRRGMDLNIALHIFPAHPKNTYLSPEDLSVQRPVLCSPSYSRRREGNAATPSLRPPREISSATEPSYRHQEALPSLKDIELLFLKHCNKKRVCKPLHLFRLLTEAIQGGVLAGSEKYLALEHCKSLVVLTDVQGNANLEWSEFKSLWDKIRRWTDIFLVFDKNKTNRLEYQEVAPALKAAGIQVDDLIMQLVGLRYTEPNMTISYPGFLFLLMKLETMIHKFQGYDMVGIGNISISYRQWLHLTMYN